MAQHGSAPAQKTAQHSPAQNPPSTGFCAGAGRGCAGLRCALSCAVRWAALGILRWPCAGAGLRWRWAALCAGCAGAGLCWRRAAQPSTARRSTAAAACSLAYFLGPGKKTNTTQHKRSVLRSTVLAREQSIFCKGMGLGTHKRSPASSCATGCVGVSCAVRWAALGILR